MCDQYKQTLMRCFTFFFILNLQNLLCILHLQHVSVHTSCLLSVLPVAIILDSADIEHSLE